MNPAEKTRGVNNFLLKIVDHIMLVFFLVSLNEVTNLSKFIYFKGGG